MTRLSKEKNNLIKAENNKIEQGIIDSWDNKERSAHLRLPHKENYLLLLNESIGIRDIKQILSCGQPTATKYYHETKEYCAANNIIILSSRGVPPVAFLEVIGRNLDYYFQLMEKERIANYVCA